MIRIYDAFRKRLEDRYENIKYDTMDEHIPNSVGIYLYPGGNDEITLDGQIVYETIKVHVQVCVNSSDLVDTLNYLRHFVDRMETEKSGVDGLEFISCQHIGPKAVSTGFNKHGLKVCVCNFELKYILY